jgi:hypothetical protein
MRGTGADRLVVAMKPGNAGGAKGTGHPGAVGGQPRCVGGPGERAKALRLDGRSPVSREAHAGFCERRGVRFPPATRPIYADWEVRPELEVAIELADPT